jgi:hypothetical protein
MLSFDENVAGSVNMNATVANAMSTYTATRSHSMASGNTGRVTTQALYDMPDPEGKHDVDLQVEDSTTDEDDGTVV